MITGSANDGRWSWHITVAHQGRYDPSWGGWADTIEEGKAAFAKQFREWINQYGELKTIPEWSRFNVKYVSGAFEATFGIARTAVKASENVRCTARLNSKEIQA